MSRLLSLRARAAQLSSGDALTGIVRVAVLAPRRSVSTEVVGSPNSGIGSSDHTAKWMTNYDLKSPQELIAEVPPIEVGARVVACEGGRDPALGHPVEYICLDLAEPNPCKYCGLRYVQAHSHHH